MKKQLIITFSLFFIILIAGCASSNPDAEGEQKELASVFDGETVRVYVEGRDKGYTPMTLRISRSRGEYDVKLKKGKELVRQYEVAIESSINRSPERQAISLNLANDNAVMGLTTFGLEDLESSNDTLYYVPYYSSAISIDDIKYGLILVISD